MASSETDEGAHPIGIVKSEGHRYVLDVKALEKALLRDHLKDSNVIVVSVTGALRRGKSFLLNFMIRYLNFTYKSENESNTSDWLGDEKRPLNGFSWRGGSEANTAGILMWSEIFSTTLPSGEKVAIILLDTQGTFDSESTMEDCTTIFSLGTILSSIQIYNLSRDIQGDDLRHLELFMEYGRLALQHDNRNKPFQKLQFLIRDWSYPYEEKYGFEGGQIVLDKKLKITDNPELASLRNNIKNCFSDIRCYLMAFPGYNVATDPEFNGDLADIAEEFKSCLKELIPALLSPENLVPKKICGRSIKVEEFVDYFKRCMDLFIDENFPEPKCILRVTAEMSNSSSFNAALDTYCQLMVKFFDESEVCLSGDQFEKKHAECEERALKQFDCIPKLGDDELVLIYRNKLIQALGELYERLKTLNGDRRKLKFIKMGAQVVWMAIGTALSAALLRIKL